MLLNLIFVFALSPLNLKLEFCPIRALLNFKSPVLFILVTKDWEAIFPSGFEVLTLNSTLFVPTPPSRLYVA
jgi:hypothetical protein